MNKNLNVYDNVLGLVGNTPLIKLNKVISEFQGSFFAKVEGFNPGHSTKDRIALYIIEQAEKKGILKSGDTIIETTSGNTGFSLAMVSIIKGYKCILAVSSKSSPDKIDMLKTMGAEVYVCPAHVPAEDPKSYYEVAKRLHKEIEGSIYINQYFNELNVEAHYNSTGAEIWNQTEGKITHLVACSGTGGTISGTAKYLKEQNPNVKVWGIDTYGSVFKKYHETGEFDKNEIYNYITEGIGEDILPENVDFDMIDHFEKVTDKDGAIMARRISREEGIMVGYSAGSAIAGLNQLKAKLTKDDVVVVIFHDHGTRYVGKLFNDEWMKEMKFM